MASKTQATLREELPLIVIDLAGEVTTFAEDVIVAAYQEASEHGALQILLNFNNVTYVNSAGIAVIIGVLQEARQREQQILVTGLTPHYTKVFHFMGLDQYIAIFDNEDDARRSMAANAHT